MWRPVPFKHSFRLAYGRTFYGTGYYIYHLSPTAGRPYPLVSRYEIGPDNGSDDWANPRYDRTFNRARMYFPAEEDSARTMSGTTQFTMRLYPDNLGVLLRRKFDYAYPNQHARVFVRASGTGDWQFAGDWYTAGSNTCVHSRPDGRSFQTGNQT